MRDLKQDGAILIKEVKGRKKVQRRKRRRRAGKIKVRVNKRKKEYAAMARKLRAYVKELKKMEKLGKQDVEDIKKKIRNKFFRSKAHLKEYVGGLGK